MKKFDSCMTEYLGIEVLPSEDPETVLAKMPVRQEICQPYGFLCGGASLAMAEIMAGIGSRGCMPEGYVGMGIQVSGSHVRPANCGTTVHAKATLLQKGGKLHVWNVDIFDEQDRLVSTSRVVNYIKQIKKAP